MFYLKQGAAPTVRIGPFLDETDHRTVEPALTISQADVRLSKNGAAAAQKNEASACSYDEFGYYRCPLDGTDTNTLGTLQLCVDEAGADPVTHEFYILPANAHDSLFGSGDVLEVDLVRWQNVVPNTLTAALNVPCSVQQWNSLAVNGPTAFGDIPCDVARWLNVVPLPLASQRLQVDTVAISADSVAADRLETMLDGTGGNILSLGQLRINSTSANGGIDIDNSGGPAISAASSFGTAVAFAAGGNGHGFTAAGLGTGDGAYFVGGINGNGLRAVGAGAGYDLNADIYGTLTGNIAGDLGGAINGNVVGNLVGNVTGSVASVSGAVASVTGNVGGSVLGNVTGNVGGNVVGTVASVVGNVGGNVAGTVASVVGNVGGNVAGSVGSVTGNVGGNVLGSVASIGAGGITAPSFGLGAIDASAIAANAIGADEFAQAAADKVWASAARTLTALGAGVITSATFAADAITAAALAADVATELQAGLATAANQTSILNRLPAALVGGRIDASVGAMAADTLTASALAASAVTEIQSGLVVAADMTAVLSRLGGFTGVGDDTVLGSLRALAGNAATNPASLVAGLTYTALANSQQALALAIAAIPGGGGSSLTAADVWTYADRRLTSAARIAVAVSGNGSMRSITELARRAYLLYPPKGPDERHVTQDNYSIRIEEAWRHLVHEGGGFYSILVEIPLEPGVRQFDLPSDMREAKLKSVYLGYDPRTISSISRTSETVTVVTAAEHGLEDDVYVKIDGVTAAGGTDFDEDSVQVTVVDDTTFTYEQAGIADDTGSGGEVQCYSSAVWLAYTEAYDLQPTPEWDATATQPSKYYFPDPMSIGIDGISNGYYPCLYLEYDAEAPEGDITGDLPGPAWLEDALISYAAWRSGAFKDGGAIFADAVKRWKVSRASRQPVGND